jgi:hypothetical protein
MHCTGGGGREENWRPREVEAGRKEGDLVLSNVWQTNREKIRWMVLGNPPLSHPTKKIRKAMESTGYVRHATE